MDLQHIHVLGYKDDDNIPGYQETVKSELAEYIRATGRFISSPQALSSPFITAICIILKSTFENSYT